MWYRGRRDQKDSRLRGFNAQTTRRSQKGANRWRNVEIVSIRGQQMHGPEIKIGEIRRSLKDFTRRQKEGAEFAQKKYIRKGKGIKEVAND